MLLARGLLDARLPDVAQVDDRNQTGVWTYETDGKPGLAVCVVGHTKQSCEALWLRYRREVLEDPVHFNSLMKRRLSVA